MNNETVNPYKEAGEQLAALEEEGKLPEGFSLEEACKDPAFGKLLKELEPYAAVRVYAAEKEAKEAKEKALEELSRQARSRSALPKSTRSAGAVPAEEDYESMSPEAFRAAENRLKKNAGRGR